MARMGEDNEQNSSPNAMLRVRALGYMDFKEKTKAMKKPIRIDIDIWNDAAKYVSDQFAIMEKYGSLSAEAKTYECWANTVHQVATYPQTLRNIQRRIDEKA